MLHEDHQGPAADAMAVHAMDLLEPIQIQEKGSMPGAGP